ncbi:hypothetical protein thsps117_34440 [Pseudomonas sp. No.117]
MCRQAYLLYRGIRDTTSRLARLIEQAILTRAVQLPLPYQKAGFALIVAASGTGLVDIHNHRHLAPPLEAMWELGRSRLSEEGAAEIGREKAPLREGAPVGCFRAVSRNQGRYQGEEHRACSPLH